MEVRDPIHHFIEYDETEERLVNSLVFQRLRNIKQLALASFVYPGAHHTRFEHSLGTMYLAGRVANQLKMDKEKQRIVRLAGLLHDIGHGPFSHVSEQILERYALNLVSKYKVENAHELMSVLLISCLEEIKGILNKEDIENVVKLLQKQEVRSIEKDIISGPLDVDKLDYLLRDSYFAGVRYGMFDSEKVIESLVPIDIAKKGVTLGIKEEGIHAVEQLLLAKYHMNAQVYSHKIRRITDAMLVRGIEFALEDGLAEIEMIFKINESTSFLQNYVSCNDDAIMSIILNKGKGSSLEYFRRIRERRLLKEVFCVKIDNINFPDSVLLDAVLNITDKHVERIAKQVAGVFSANSHKVPHTMVTVDKQTISNPTFKSPRVRIDSNTIMVRTRSEKKEFPAASDLFRNPGIDPESNTLRVYLPLDWMTDKEQRTKYIQERESSVKAIIQEAIK